jgi:hypothetical protein
LNFELQQVGLCGFHRRQKDDKRKRNVLNLFLLIQRHASSWDSLSSQEMGYDLQHHGIIMDSAFANKKTDKFEVSGENCFILDRFQIPAMHLPDEIVWF